MQDRSSYDYIHIGLIIRALQHKGVSYGNAFGQIKVLFELFDEADLEVSKSFTESDEFDDFLEKISEENKNNKTSTLIKEDASSLVELLQSLEQVVFAESAIKKIYTIPSRRYNVKYLLNTPDKLFKDGHYSALSDLAKLDIASSARCIVFGEATASAFHILRATEDTLKKYYLLHRKQKRLQKPMWANMVDQLKAKKNNRPSKALLDSLDMVRGNYRNPTQHPEAIYNIDTAQDLFGVCIDVLGKMAEEL